MKKILTDRNVIVLCFQGNAYCILMCKILGIKVIVRSNSSPSGWSKKFLKIIAYKTIYSLADEVIVNSVEFKNEMKKKFNINAICIYNPFNLKETQKFSKKKVNFKFFKKNFLNVINVARLNEQKNQIFLLKAIQKINETLPVKLLLIGDGNEKEKIINFINNNKMKNYVRMIGFKKNPFPYILKADLFILSSKYEGLPNILLETIAIKKPILSSNCPTGPKEILDNGKGGMLYRYKNLSDLTKKIFLFNKFKKQSNKKIEHSYRRLDRFEFNKNINKYYSVLRKHLFLIS